ncbi:hypothetical protein CRG98_027848 [Punica granatum]|uniref:Uncharacterized protein n=1 Tax=Punica granatum TaxID=22663 RepID=A0A2I0J7E1_PUNGR|nr:hypothetical protein CRG98_027848 [Punica granatum]
MPTRDIVVPNQFATIHSRLAILLGLRDEEIRRELQHGWDHSIRTEWLVDFIYVPSLNATGESYQRDACHGFLLLIFGTILLPYSSNLIDGALAQVILQFLWAARWNLGGPMTIRCPSVIGLPLISHLGSTLIFPGRVIRQLDGHTGSHGQTLQVHSLTSFYKFERFDACGARTLFGLAPVFHLRMAQIPRAPQVDIPDAESFVQGAICTELQTIREEQDRLLCKLVDMCSKLTGHRELQSELAQICARIASQDREIAHLSAMLDRARAKACKVLTTGVASIPYSSACKDGRRTATPHFRTRDFTNADSFSNTTDSSYATCHTRGHIHRTFRRPYRTPSTYQ